MDMSSFKLDIDELINEFTESKSVTLDDMKRVWLSRKFSYIYEARPSSNLAFFMQSLYSHSISYMSDTASISHRLGGLYCLYCLYETQPCKPPFKIYLSLGDLKKLKDLAANAKEKGVEVAPALIKRMLDRKIFLFGFVDINESSVRERVNDLADLQNARIQVAYNKLLANSRIEHFLHMDMVSFINPYNRKCWKSMAMAPAEQIFKCIPTAWKLILISETHDRILILASNLGSRNFFTVIWNSGSLINQDNLLKN